MHSFIHKYSKYTWLLIAGLILSACASAQSVTDSEQSQGETVGQPGSSPEVAEPDSTLPTDVQSEDPRPSQPTSDPVEIPAVTPTISPGEEPPAGALSQFSTDFSKHSVSYSEILSGGPPKDGIPAIDSPQFVAVAEADEWLAPQEPVILFKIDDDARAYPLQILTWHEIVNDVVGGEPVVVTFCPLCNTAIAFKSTVNGQVFDFGTTGRLRFSNLIMYDRQTETWWQQASGEAIAGELTGEQLEFVPATIIAWEQFKQEHPDGKVLSRETGFPRSYGRNPYTGYDNINNSPFLFKGPQTPGTLPPMARVITVDLGGEAVAYPYEVLQEAHVVNDTIAGKEVVVIWEPGTASALDSGSIAGGRDVGTAAVYSRQLEGQTLAFSFDGSRILDDQTGSQWNVLGQAVSGELAGTRLEEVVSINHFWFSWAAFKPDTRIYQP
jgi:hypothetical protein